MAGKKHSAAKRVTAKRSSAKRAGKPRPTKRGGARHHDDEQAIKDLDAAWSEAAGKMDLERVVGFYAPDGSVVWPDHPAAHGKAAIRNRWAELFKTTPGLFLKFAPERIVIAADRALASDFGVVHFGFDTPRGPQRQTGKYVVVWRREKGQWKVLYDCYNMNEPAKS
jgi:uncharacterized protein (TIGR02246 family)